MVEPRIRNKPDNPNRTSRQFTSPQDMNIVPAEGPSRFQRGINMISNYFSDLSVQRNPVQLFKEETRVINSFVFGCIIKCVPVT